MDLRIEWLAFAVVVGAAAAKNQIRMVAAHRKSEKSNGYRLDILRKFPTEKNWSKVNRIGLYAKRKH